MKRLLFFGLILSCLLANGQQRHTVGTYEIIGVGKYPANEEFIRQFDSWLATQQDETRLHLADVRDALLRGETVTYDANRNYLSANVIFTNISDRQKERLRKRPTGAGLFFDALFNTGRQQVSVAIDALKGFKPVAYHY